MSDKEETPAAGLESKPFEVAEESLVSVPVQDDPTPMPPQMGQQIIELPEQAFFHVIRTIRKSMERAKQMAIAAEETLKNLNIPPKLEMAFDGTLADLGVHNVHGNMGDIVTWMGKIKKTDTEAVRQLQAIHATAVKNSK